MNNKFDQFIEDSDRSERTGLDEAIFCASKTANQIGMIVAQLSENSRRALFTRLSPDQLAAMDDNQRSKLAYDAFSQTAILGAVTDNPSSGSIAIISAGTSDAQVAAEAAQTLAYYGYSATIFQDVGVAGLWRVLRLLELLRDYPVIIAIAGMDAALPTVLAGLVPSLIIAVPTSVGYGVAQGGTSALNSLLSSCASGLVVVNIDNGYGAACAAVKVLKNFDRLRLKNDAFDRDVTSQLNPSIACEERNSDI